MDVNGMPIEGFYSTNLPAGLGAAPPLSAALPPKGTGVVRTEDRSEILQTDQVTESEMERILMEYKDAGSEKKAEAVLDAQVSDAERASVLDRLEAD